MGVIYTGMQRATELTVTKMIAEEIANGYPRIYKVYEAFGNFTAITIDVLAQLKVEDYLARLDGFKTYVESVEVGVIVNLEKAYKENLDSCPIG